MAEALNVEFYDRDLIEAAAKKMNMSLSIASDLEESARPNRFWRMCFPLGHDESRKQDELFQVEKKIILDLADAKRKTIAARYKDLCKTIRPLVLIQFPNGQPETIRAVEAKLESMGYTALLDMGGVMYWPYELEYT